MRCDTLLESQSIPLNCNSERNLMQNVNDAVFEEIKWDSNGLVPAIAQDAESGRVLMMAWMNKTALTETLTHGEAVYYSRSRQKLWHKGEQSGHTQTIKTIEIDCDGDVILLKIQQHGGIACHTGRESCFYRTLETKNGHSEWIDNAPVLKSPEQIYQ